MTSPRPLVCCCPAYAWPHRRTSGKCIWNPQHSEPHCEDCGQACECLVYTQGPEEHNHRVPATGAVCSRCCSSAVVANGRYLEASEA